MVSSVRISTKAKDLAQSQSLFSRVLMKTTKFRRFRLHHKFQLQSEIVNVYICFLHWIAKSRGVMRRLTFLYIRSIVEFISHITTARP